MNEFQRDNYWQTKNPQPLPRPLLWRMFLGDRPTAAKGKPRDGVPGGASPCSTSRQPAEGARRLAVRAAKARFRARPPPPLGAARIANVGFF
jgi:hypothetical protein